MSDSVRPHRQQPTRLPHPWDSPGKNTGVRCHFLLQCMKVKSESEVTESCPTLSDPMDCSTPGSSVHEILQARTLEWVAISFSRGSSQPQGSNLRLLHWQADSLPLSHQGSPSTLYFQNHFHHAKQELCTHSTMTYEWNHTVFVLLCLSTMWETWVRSLGREDPLEKEMATHSSILAWRIPWMEEPGGLQSTGSQRIGHN